MNTRPYKRQYRELDNETKIKISNATRGKSKSPSHKAKLSHSMTEYWKTVEHRPQPDNADQQTTMDGLIGANQNKPNKQ